MNRNKDNFPFFVFDTNPFTNLLKYAILTKSHRGVAQFGRALRSGRRGRKFESCHLDHHGHTK